MLYRQNPNYVFAAMALDLLAAYGTLRLAYQQYTTQGGFATISNGLVVLILLVQLVVFLIMGLYDSKQTYRAVDEFQLLIGASIFSLLATAGALYIVNNDIPRLITFSFFVANLVMLISWRLLVRFAFRFIKKNSGEVRRVLVVGAGVLGQQIARKIQAEKQMGVEFIGFLDDEKTEAIGGMRVLGTLKQARQLVKQFNIAEVVIALPNEAYQKIDQTVVQLHNSPVQIRIAPNYFSLALHHATVEDFSGVPLINLRDPALSDSQRMIKRAFDLFVSGLGLICAAPIMALVAIAIRLDSPGPVIFRQRRVGENGKLFTILKFRSMFIDAEARAKDVIKHDENGNIVHKMKNDPRVTRVGDFIRKTSLDELPQLINIFLGDMSLVGPRPELPWLVENYEPWQSKRFAVPQGLTGWWQIHGRSDKPLHLHTEEDIYYVQNYSLLLDLRILWMTIPALLKRRGAF